MTITRKGGYVKLERVRGYGWYLTKLWVDREHRGKGVARMLMRAVVRQCGDRPIYLLASSEYGTSLDFLYRFYGEYGFNFVPRPRSSDFPYNYNMVR